MARQHDGEVFDFSDMTDTEIRQVVVEHFRESPTLDADAIRVNVRDGQVFLEGRVGTDGEVQIAEAILDDVLGIENYSNDLVVDESYRYSLPEAADDAAEAIEEMDDQLGDTDDQQSDTAEHLQEDVETETYGTHDVGTAVRDGAAYTPPDRPMPDGYDSRENH